MSRSRRSAAAGSGLSLIRGERISLRPLTENEAIMPVGRGPSLDRGRAGALPYDGYDQLVAEMPQLAADTVRLAIVRESDGTVIGLLDCRADEAAAGRLTFERVKIEPGRRGWGYGSEAVRLVEVEVGGGRFLANVDAGNGLGLYFWLRLGYRPARLGEMPGRPPRGMITMVRSADAPGRRPG